MSARRACIATACLVLALAGCSTPVKLAPVRAEWGGAQVPGRYAVTVQHGAFAKTIEATGFACSGWDYPTEADAAFQAAMRGAIEARFEHVVFTPELTPEEIAAQGFDAALIVYQGAFATRLLVEEDGYYQNAAAASVKLGGIVALVGPGGLVGQASPEGQGFVRRRIVTCDDAGPIVGAATRMAVTGLVQKAIAEAVRIAARP